MTFDEYKSRVDGDVESIWADCEEELIGLIKEGDEFHSFNDEAIFSYLDSTSFSPEEALEIFRHCSYEESDSGLWEGKTDYEEILEAKAYFTYRTELVEGFREKYEACTEEFDTAQAELQTLLDVAQESLEEIQGMRSESDGVPGSLDARHAYLEKIIEVLDDEDSLNELAAQTAFNADSPRWDKKGFHAAQEARSRIDALENWFVLRAAAEESSVKISHSAGGGVYYPDAAYRFEEADKDLVILFTEYYRSSPEVLEKSLNDQRVRLVEAEKSYAALSEKESSLIGSLTEGNYTKAIELLLDDEVSSKLPSLRIGGDNNLLHIIAKQEHPDEIYALSRVMGIDPNLRNEKGELPLTVAVDRRKKGAADVFSSMVSTEGLSADLDAELVVDAVKMSFPTVVENLIARGMPVDYHDADGNNLLAVSVDRARYALTPCNLKMLSVLGKVVRGDEKNELGVTALEMLEGRNVSEDILEEIQAGTASLATNHGGSASRNESEFSL